MKYCKFLIIGFLLSSCATLVYHRTVDLNVYADTDSVKICVNNDTTKWYNTPARVNVARSGNDLLIIAKKDSIQKLIQVHSRLTTAFWLGNIFSGAGVLGYAIDLTNPKRFTYPSDITIDFKSNKRLIKYRNLLSPEKGLLNFKVSIPESNHFYINKGKGYGNSFGFLMTSAGLEYYILDPISISSDVGVLADYMIPFLVGVDYWGPHESSLALYTNIQMGSDIKRFHYGIGLQYNKTIYEKWDTLHSTSEHSFHDTLNMRKVQNNAGLVFSTYYRISNVFNVGISYYPSILAWDRGASGAHYSHLLFFELIFKLEAYRPKQKRN